MTRYPDIFGASARESKEAQRKVSILFTDPGVGPAVRLHGNGRQLQ